MSPESLLEVRGIEAGYGQVRVLWGVDLAVHERESVVLLGANGAGKTTLLRTVMGLLAAWAGSIRFAGEDVTRLRTDHRVRRGIVYMSESAGFADLTVEENIRIGAQFLRSKEIRARAEELYGIFPALAERRRALAGKPRLLVMDEPSAGLSPLFVKEVVRVLGRFRGQGLALLIAEQNVRFLDLADRVYTIEGGRIGFCGSVAAMHENDALHRAYFGLK